MTKLATTTRICEHLEKYVFDRVWNEPYSEFRSYVRPVILNDCLSRKRVIDADGFSTVTRTYAPAAGFFQGRYSRILLPPYKSNAELQQFFIKGAGTFFYVYAISKRFFGEIAVNVAHTWTPIATRCDKSLLDLQVFTDSGIVLNRGSIYIKQAAMNDCILMAVDFKMFGRVAPGCDPSKIIVGKYVDSDYDPDNQLNCFKVDSTQDPTNTRYRPSGDQGLSKATYNLYNGRFYAGTGAALAAAIREGNYVESAIDNDVIGMFDVECSEDKGAPYYTFVTGEGVTDKRLIVHIPKAMNPNNYLITSNTCDLFLIPRSVASGDPIKQGVYLYPCTGLYQVTSDETFLAVKDYYVADERGEFVLLTDYNVGDPIPTSKTVYEFPRGTAYHQLTHNDFSIDQSLLTRVAHEHGFGEYYLKVLVRTHNKKKVFVRDVNYVDVLYNLDDETIVQIMRTLHPWQTGTPVLTDYVPELSTYWYEDDQSVCGWNSVTGRIVDHATFEAERAKHGDLYSTPRDLLLFWSADELESSQYADALMRRINTLPHTITHYQGEASNPQCEICRLRDACTNHLTDEKAQICPYFSARSIRDYIEILGYFHVLSLIGKRVTHFEITKDGTAEVVVFAPVALSAPELNVEDFYPLFYHNGVRIDQDRLTVTETTKDNDGVSEIRSRHIPFGQDVIQRNYTSRMLIKVTPTYTPSTDYAFRDSKQYYKCSVTYELTDDTVFLKDVAYYTYTDAEPTYYVKLVPGTAEEVEIGYADYVPGVTPIVDHSHQGKAIFRMKDPVYTLAVGTTEENYEKAEDKSVYDYVYGRPLPAQGPRVAEDQLFYFPDIEFRKGDTLAVELYDSRYDADDFRISHHVPPNAVDPYDIKMMTEDQWKVYLAEPVDATQPTKGIKYTVIDRDAAGTWSKESMTLTVNPNLNNKHIVVVEGPVVKVDQIRKDVDVDTFGYLGQGMWVDVNNTFFSTSQTLPNNMNTFPLDTEVLFLNGKRLIRGLDYSMDGYDYSYSSEDERYGVGVYCQNLSYVRQKNTLDVLRTSTSDIDTKYGFLVGSNISWSGQAPFWFDELSTLTIDGVLCSHVVNNLGEVKITDTIHRNGAPYEIRTAVSTRVKDILGCDDLMAEDKFKIVVIREFFTRHEALPDMQTIIPHSHKIYSIYLEKICGEYLTNPTFDFKQVGEYYCYSKLTPGMDYHEGEEIGEGSRFAAVYVEQEDGLAIDPTPVTSGRLVSDFRLATGYFQEKTVYYTRTEDGKYVPALIKVGAAIPENKYYTRHEKRYYLKDTEITPQGLEPGVKVTDENFERQFVDWAELKAKDVAYQLSEYDLGFVDVFPLYHRAEATSHTDYEKLRYLVTKLSPADRIKHRSAFQ